MIKIISNITITEPIRWALDRLQAELKEKELSFEFDLKLMNDDGIEAQGYERKLHNGSVLIKAGDDAGFMYGILDLSRDIIHKKGLINLQDLKVTPYIKMRGIKFNIPLDARTPSYSDASDSAFYNIENMWDFGFWTEFLDRMAMDRYNVLSLWSLSPFPSLVRTKKYPKVALDDVKVSLRPIKTDLAGLRMYDDDMEESLVTVKKMSIEEKIEFWKSVMEYAHNRCIKIFLFTWNLFVYGTENNPYGITCDMDNPVTKDYIYHSVYDLMDTYPLLSGIGVTAGENMKRDERDIKFLADTYGKAVRDYIADHPDREFRFIHRLHYAGYEHIVTEFNDFPCNFEISFKYSQAHMYSSIRPAFIDDFLKIRRNNHKLWLTVRNDDFYMYRWGNPEFAREYLKNMPVDIMTGFYMGADGFTWGRDYLDLRDTSNPLFIAKMWYMIRIWGLLSYRIDLADGYFTDELSSHFNISNIEAKELYGTWKEASEIVPELNRVHWHDFDFQWYPEGSCMYDFEKDKLIFADINEFINCPVMPGENIHSVNEYCRLIAEGKTTEKISPLSVADNIYNHAENAINGVLKLRAGITDNNELLYTLDDIEALGYLGHYYAAKLKAAVYLCLYRYKNIEKYRLDAKNMLERAAENWLKYSAKSKSMYKPQLLGRLLSFVDLQRFDKLVLLDILHAENP